MKATPNSALAYLKEFCLTFIHECYGTWRQELLASVGVAFVSYLLMVRSHEPAALNNFKVSLIATGLVLCGFAAWHLTRTPFLLHKRTVEKLALESQRNNAGRVSPADWREISEKFGVLGSRQISAQYQTTRAITRWTLHDTHCKALCTLAGTMLVTSEGVSTHLPDGIKDEFDPVARWLEYLKKTTSSASYRREYLTENLIDGETLVHILGRIDNVPNESAAVCLKCCAQELAG
jgi:hypothetical protein